MNDKQKEVKVHYYPEDMVVYWDAKGNVLARVIFEDGEDLEEVEEYLYPAMVDVFGKDEQLNDIVQNSSYEHSEEWRENE